MTAYESTGERSIPDVDAADKGLWNGMTLGLPRSFMFACLFSVFSLSYLITPYWAVFQEWEKVIALIGTTGLGLAWATLSSNRVALRIQRLNPLPYLLILIILGLLNYRPLFSVIPWRGDEDYHIWVTLSLWKSFRPALAVLGAVFFAWFLFGAWRENKWSYFPSLLLLLAVPLVGLSFIDLSEKKYFEVIFRYPFLIKYINAIPLYIASALGSVFHEAVFRVIPFISIIILACYCNQKLSTDHRLIGLLFGISVGTIPLIFYYSSILYIEMPAVLLMTISCLGIEDLLKKREITDCPAWYALIVVGFIKETTIPFLISFVLLRLIFRTLSLLPLGISFSDIVDEAKVIFCTLLPTSLFVAYRSQFDVWRKYSSDFSQLIDPEVYITLTRSFWDQFGPFIFLFFGGCLVLAYRRHYRALLFLVIAFGADLMFHVIDDAGYIWIGYSRFNLFLAPIVIAGAYYLLRFLSDNRPRWTGYLLVVVIAVNVILSPVNIDGTKKPLWGNYLSDTSEHYYPYGKAISWMKDQHPSDNIMFAGMDYVYYFEFYFQKFEWFPTFDKKFVKRGEGAKEGLERILDEAGQEGYPVVLYHVLGVDMPEPADLHGFVLEKTFKNDAHTLMLYSKELTLNFKFQKANNGIVKG